ncbi:ATP-dependent Clp protease ATP-binding subunit ClpA [Bacteriovoracaceae bacterium]|nr:ATP-dependent Clp protease ATP-binding subunit ClpA [Bacteriovoracaceae bacterium]
MIGSELEFLLNKAVKRANERKHEFLSLENVLLAILEDEEVEDILTACGADITLLTQELTDFLDDIENFSLLSDTEIERLNKEQFLSEELREMAAESGIKYQPDISLSLQRVIQRAALHIQSSGKSKIEPINLLVAIFSEKESQAAYLLNKQNVERLNVVEKIAHGIDGSVNQTDSSSSDKVERDPLQKQSKFEKALKDFTVDLTHEAQEGRLDPTIGRKDEITRIIQILSRRRKNNPILVGDSGVGKTAIAEGLAQAIVNQTVPENLLGARIYSLDMASLLAGTKFRGDFEERLKLVVSALEQRTSKQSKILFIDEIHTIIGAGSTSGGSLDASNLLKPALSKGQLRCMGSTTYDEYRKFFEKDQALSRRFQKVDIPEPSRDDTIEIIEGLKNKFEEHHGVTFSKEVIEAAVDLAEKHINERKLPDKAIDVIDEVGAYLRLKPEKERRTYATLDDVEHIIALIARIPQKSITANEKDKLKNLERDLKYLLFGQDQAISKVNNAIILSRSGLGSADRPIASFLFSGPTGVGKTELAKQLSNIMGIHFQRIDMSEFMEKHSISKLIGAPPGYVGFDQGGILTDNINKNPYSVLLLDEIEKAHPDVFNLLLQVMDHGKLTDSNGRTTDFRNVILILTSNAGAKEYETGSIGLGSANTVENTSKRDQAIKNFFSPEFRNRLDAIVHFKKLSQVNILSIVDKFLMELENQLLDKGVDMEVESEAKLWLAKKGYDPKLGARPISRLINEIIKKPLANEILFGKLANGGKIIIGFKDDKLSFNYKTQKVPQI